VMYRLFLVKLLTIYQIHLSLSTHSPLALFCILTQ
jgi:hypothetical protein